MRIALVFAAAFVATISSAMADVTNGKGLPAEVKVEISALLDRTFTAPEERAMAQSGLTWIEKEVKSCGWTYSYEKDHIDMSILCASGVFRGTHKMSGTFQVQSGFLGAFSNTIGLTPSLMKLLGTTESCSKVNIPLTFSTEMTVQGSCTFLDQSVATNVTISTDMGHPGRMERALTSLLQEGVVPARKVE